MGMHGFDAKIARMQDPMALITDSALGLAAWIFAARLWRVQRMWALAFVFTGIAAFCGGVFHGFGDAWPLLWKVTVMSVGVASFFLLAGTDQRLAIVATIKLIAYLTWMIGHNAFIYVVLDSGLTLLLAGIFHPAKKWVWGSIAVSVVGAVVQGAQLTIHPRWFDYNDLYHLIQIAALWMLYRAALRAHA
jgi:hypothetical protein